MRHLKVDVYCARYGMVENIFDLSRTPDQHLASIMKGLASYHLTLRHMLSGYEKADHYSKALAAIPHLEDLTIRWSELESEHHMAKLGSAHDSFKRLIGTTTFPHLQILTLVYKPCPLDMLAKVLRGSPNLRRLSLVRIYALTGLWSLFAAEIRRSMPQLVKVVLSELKGGFKHPKDYYIDIDDGVREYIFEKGPNPFRQQRINSFMRKEAKDRRFHESESWAAYHERLHAQVPSLELCTRSKIKQPCFLKKGMAEY